jgi:hypothetical protein
MRATLDDLMSKRQIADLLTAVRRRRRDVAFRT